MRSQQVYRCAATVDESICTERVIEHMSVGGAPPDRERSNVAATPAWFVSKLRLLVLLKWVLALYCASFMPTGAGLRFLNSRPTFSTVTTRWSGAVLTGRTNVAGALVEHWPPPPLSELTHGVSIR